jgi:enterochelin esterase-like enzyme
MPALFKKSLVIFILIVFSLLALASCGFAKRDDISVPDAQASADALQKTNTVVSPTATPKTVACTETKGLISDYSVPSKILKQPVALKVYTPPCYDETGNYPVLYMLHGTTYSNDQWMRLGIADAADEMIASKEISPLIIVMPQEDASMADPTTSKYGEAIVKEVIPWVDASLATCPARTCRAIGGLSRGGNWAVRLGFSEYQYFIAVGAHSTPLFVGDLFRLGYWVRDLTSLELAPQIYMDMGKSDENRVNIQQFDDELTRLKVPHQFFIFDGLHDETYWSAHVKDYLRWYSQVFSSR